MTNSLNDNKNRITVSNSMAQFYSDKAEESKNQAASYAAQAKASAEYAEQKATEIDNIYDGSVEEITSSKTGALSEINAALSSALSSVSTSKDGAIDEIETTSETELTNILSEMGTEGDSIIASISATEEGAVAAVNNVKTSAINEMNTQKAAIVEEAETTMTSAKNSAVSAAQTEITSAKNNLVNAAEDELESVKNAALSDAQADITTSKNSAIEAVEDAQSSAIATINNERNSAVSTAESEINAAKNSALSEMNIPIQKAKDWATKTDAPVEGNLYSAKYYAEKAEDDVRRGILQATETELGGAKIASQEDLLNPTDNTKMITPPKLKFYVDTALQPKAEKDEVVNLTLPQTVGGEKTFTTTPKITTGYLNFTSDGVAALQRQGVNFCRNDNMGHSVLSTRNNLEIFLRCNGDSNPLNEVTINKDGQVTAKKFVGEFQGKATQASHADQADYAESATTDSSGNNIVGTYATKTELSTAINALPVLKTYLNPELVPDDTGVVTWTITHTLNTQNMFVGIRKFAGSVNVNPDSIAFPSTTQVVVKMQSESTIAANSYMATLIG